MCQSVAVVLAERGQGAGDELGAPVPPGVQAAGRRLGQVELGAAPIPGVGVAAQVTGRRELVDQGADRVAGQLEGAGGR